MKLLMLSDYSSHNSNVMRASLDNHLRYCCKYGIDTFYMNKPYSPHNDFRIMELYSLYDYIITVGTDILFTNFNKDIRDFLTDSFITIQLQDGRDNYTVNGDFIIWKYDRECFEEFSLEDRKYRNSQEAVNKLRYTDWKDCMRILPCRTLQSVMETPFMPPRSRQRP